MDMNDIKITKNEEGLVIISSDDYPQFLSPEEKEAGVKRELIIQFDDEENNNR